MLRNHRLTELRDEAKAIGARWRDVVWLKNELVEIERVKRQPEAEARQAAWCACVGWGSGSAPFWRHGFRSRFGRRLARGSDYTIIPRYDEIAAAAREMSPEYSGWSTAEIWELLLSDYEPWPPRETFYEQAIDELSHCVNASTSEPAGVSLGSF